LILSLNSAIFFSMKDQRDISLYPTIRPRRSFGAFQDLAGIGQAAVALQHPHSGITGC
jgi:hypothetical protein